MNALSKASLLQPQSQTSNDACPPASSAERQESGVEFVSKERMTILGLEGPGLPLAPPPEPGRFREALNALLKRSIVTTQALLEFLAGLRDPLRRAQRALFERWMAADFRTRQLPVLAIAATIWMATAWIAWRAEDSSTPLLRHSLAVARSQPVRPVALAAGPTSGPIAEPPDPQDGVQPESLTQQIPPSPLLDRIVEFFVARPTPARDRPANRRLQVWADTHTGLYYCPGEGGHRWRSRGRYMSQEEAQDDYFQPASGAACP